MDMDFNKILAAFSAVTGKQTLSEAAEKKETTWTDKSGKKHPATQVKGEKYTGKEAEKEEKKEVKESSLSDLIAKMDAIIAEEKSKKADKDYDGDGEIESEKDEVIGSRRKAAGLDEAAEKKETTWTDKSGKKHPATQVKGEKYTGKEAEKEDKKKVDEAEKSDKPWTDMKGNKHPGTAVKGEKYTGKEAEKEDKKKVDESTLAECGMMGDESESGMSVNTSVDTRTGRKTVSISADGESADQLMQMLKLAGVAGMGGDKAMGDVDGDGDHDLADHAQEMGGEVEVVSVPLSQHEGGIDFNKEEEVDETYSNEPHPQTQGVDTQLRQGTDLNKEKTMHKHSYRQGDNPMAMREAAELAALEQEIMEELNSIKVKKPTGKYGNSFKKPAAVKKVK